jgi:hypothetical protein
MTVLVQALEGTVIGPIFLPNRSGPPRANVDPTRKRGGALYEDKLARACSTSSLTSSRKSWPSIHLK